MQPSLQAPQTSKRQLLSSSKTPIQGIQRRGYPQLGRWSNKKMEYRRKVQITILSWQNFSSFSMLNLNFLRVQHYFLLWHWLDKRAKLDLILSENFVTVKRYKPVSQQLCPLEWYLMRVPNPFFRQLILRIAVRDNEPDPSPSRGWFHKLFCTLTWSFGPCAKLLCQ